MQTQSFKPSLTPKHKSRCQATQRVASPFSEIRNQFLPDERSQRTQVHHKKNIQKKKVSSKQVVLATVYINMGEDRERPVLTVKNSTNVHELINNFIIQYRLPKQAYDIIFKKVDSELRKEGIDVNQLGKRKIENSKQNIVYNQLQDPEHMEHRVIPHRQPKDNLKNVALDRNISPNQIKQTKMKYKIPINHQQKLPKAQKSNQNSLINIKRKKSISPIRLTNPDALNCSKPSHQPQMAFSKTRTPLRSRPTTFHQVQGLSSASKTTSEFEAPNKKQDRLQTEVIKKIENLYQILTQNQPKNIMTLCPQYINFDGIGPQTLSVLQDFFQNIHEREFNYMTKNYFINKMIELGTYNKIAKSLIHQNT